VSAGANHETEIKLRIPGPAEGRALLEKAGFVTSVPRVFEDNLVLDTPDLRLRRAGELLRLRSAAGVATLTFKGPAIPGPHKSREEIETRLLDARAAETIFARLGFEGVFRYQKYRTEYARAGESGVATLDETPIGCYLELEGAPEWIDSTARLLGFKASEYITASYGGLYRDYCVERKIEPGHMVFEDPDQSR
jgi:adenylate cyclase, class 2